ncbi:MAG: tetratricopeptide repeat protein [Burkholderiaceae bacterium]
MKSTLLIASVSAALLLAGCAGMSPAPAAKGDDKPTAVARQNAGDTDENNSADKPDAASPTAGGGIIEPPDTDGPLPKVDLTREIMFQVLAAEIAAQNGQLSAATATYLSLAESIRDPRLARRATELALSEKSLDHALRAAQLWHELSPDSANATQTIEALWLATGQLSEAEPLIASRLARARATNTLPESYQQLARLLARSSDSSGALALLERVSQPDQELPEAHLALAGVAAAGGDNDRAASEAEQAFKLRPDSEHLAILTAQYLQQSTRGNGGAEQLLAGFLGRKPGAVEVRFAYARVLAAQNKTEEASRQMNLALKQEPSNPAILLSMAQLSYQLKQTRAAEGYLDRYLALPPDVQRDNATAWLFHAQIAEDEQRLDDAQRWLAKITRGEQFLPALSRRALLMARQGKIDEARQLLRSTTVTTNRERNLLTSAEAQVLRQTGQYQAAFDVLDQALQRQPDNPDLLYDQAMAAEKIDRIDVLETSLRKLISLRPNQAHAYNALGYTFADRNIRLDEAQALIDKALALAPDDPHIVDSLGWLYYRQGKLDRAVEVLRQAYTLKPEPDIAAHLGEVLWQSGQTAEAREMWAAAMKADPANETLKETLARLNVSL